MPVTEASVRDIMDTALKAPQIRAFIDDATLWVTEELAAEGLSDERLELITRYLACALIRLRDLGLTSGELKDVKEKYQVDPEVTDYLLRAASFDPTGKLRRTFLADASGAGASTYPVRFRVGTQFTDSECE
jgi:hypothetical protein